MQRLGRLSEPPEPYEYFHLIGGTSTGGWVSISLCDLFTASSFQTDTCSSLIAVLLGRLHMTIAEAMAIYYDLSATVFPKGGKLAIGTYDHKPLETIIQKIVRERERGDKMLDKANDSELGHSFVCAIPSHDYMTPTRFRSYHIEGDNQSPACAIWEACRATSAAPGYFLPMEISWGDQTDRFLDGGLGCNNPAQWVLTEAELLLGSDRKFGCLISLGTGDRSNKSAPGRGHIDRLKLRGLGIGSSFNQIRKYVSDIISDSRKTDHILKGIFENHAGSYYRFNVPGGADGIDLGDASKLPEIVSRTKSYLARREVSSQMDEVAGILYRKSSPGLSLSRACEWSFSSRLECCD